MKLIFLTTQLLTQDVLNDLYLHLKKEKTLKMHI